MQPGMAWDNPIKTSPIHNIPKQKATTSQEGKISGSTPHKSLHSILLSFFFFSNQDY
jgi:hypothetical protein